jgi:HAD superfamily hydrolase (TIGR01509 family)
MPAKGRTTVVKCIFWDNDGVLVDTEKLYFQASAEVLRTAGVELTPTAFADISLRRGESVLELAANLAAEEKEMLRRVRNARYAELLGEEVQVIAGVAEVLQALHGRLRMAIVTSSRRDHFTLIHRSTGLLPFFEFVLTREDYTHSKPHPEPYLAALARSGLRAAECVVIEDSERGLAAARGAGICCFAVPGRLNRHGDFSTADRVLGSIREIPAALFPSFPEFDLQR